MRIDDDEPPWPVRTRQLTRDLLVVALLALTTSLVLGAVHGDGRPVPVLPDLTVPLRPLGPAAAWRNTLDGLVVLARRPDVPGYNRACGDGDGCVFGPAWSDDVDVAGGHNGVDTRTDIITRDTAGRGTAGGNTAGRDGAKQDSAGGDSAGSDTPGSGEAGTAVLLDPYSGHPTTEIQIDHLVPLAAAWDLGAARWPLSRREDFANDPTELLSVSAAENQLKTDETPGDWAGCLRVPGPCDHAKPAMWFPRAAIRCALAQHYIQICRDYGLPVTEADRRSLLDMLATCSA